MKILYFIGSLLLLGGSGYCFYNAYKEITTIKELIFSRPLALGMILFALAYILFEASRSEHKLSKNKWHLLSFLFTVNILKTFDFC